MSHLIIAFAMLAAQGKLDQPKHQIQCAGPVYSNVGNAKTIGADYARICVERSDDSNSIGNAKTVGGDQPYVEIPATPEIVGNSKTVGQ